MSNSELIAVIALIITIVGAVYSVAQIEARIYKNIDEINDRLSDRINTLERRVDVHLQDYVNGKEMNSYMVNGLDQKLDHKFNRLYGAQKDIQGYLKKKFEFHPREHFTVREDATDNE